MFFRCNGGRSMDSKNTAIAQDIVGPLKELNRGFIVLLDSCYSLSESDLTNTMRVFVPGALKLCQAVRGDGKAGVWDSIHVLEAG